MKTHLLLTTVFFLLSLTVHSKETVKINTNWKFNKSDVQDAQMTNFDDSSWENITLPHSWNAFDGQDGGNDYYRGVGWYRVSLNIPASDYEGKVLYLKIGAANIISQVYMNGSSLGIHAGGYAAFMYEITDKLIDGQNVIAVKVDNSKGIICPPLSADFTFFGGITRDVEIITAEPVHIDQNEFIANETFVPGGLNVASHGVQIKQTNVSANSADIEVVTKLRNTSGVPAMGVVVEALIKDANGNVVKQLSESTTMVGETDQVSLSYTMSNPHLWDGLNDPYLYRVEVSVKKDGKVVDSSVQPLGIRFFRVDPNLGFFLNGKAYPLRGLCFHEEKKDKGRAVSDADRKEAIDMLAETGANYFRISHYQHGDFTYDYLDSLGIICWTEVPVINSVGGNASENSIFKKNSVSQMYELIRQNYNHPCVVFWGLCNEINYQPGISPVSTVQLLNDLVKSEDPYRLTALAAMYGDRPTNSIPDVQSNNRYDGWYYNTIAQFGTEMDKFHTMFPTRVLGVSEYGVGANINQHEYPAKKPNEGGQYHPEEYQNLYHEEYLKMINARPYIWSSSVWAGFDFASDGRNEGSQPGINDKGLITFDRSIKKDAYYWYKANWNKEDKFVYITSRRYTLRRKNETTVRIYSNCESVSLKVNGVTYTAKTSDDHIFNWDNIPLVEGENQIEATATSGSNEYKDNVVWTYEPAGMPVVPPGEIQINFEKTNTVTPEGYLKDDGSIFGERGNGYNYGWSVNNTGNNRERGKVEKRFDTFIQMQTSGNKYTWSIDLPNGSYTVSVACGDPDYNDSFHQIAANGVTVLAFQPTTDDRFGAGTAVVEVTDGKLLIEPKGSNTKIDFVHITKGATGISESVAPGISAYIRNGALYIDNNSSDSYSASLYDISGKFILKKKGLSGNSQIDLPGSSKDVYLLRINNKVLKVK